jgi:hypothetical protein
MRRNLVAGLLCLALAAGAAGAAWADSVTVDDLAARAATGNLDLVKARAAVSESRADLASQATISSSRLSLSAGYDTGSAGSGGAGGGQSAAGVQAQAQVSVPVIPQISIGGSVSSQGTAAVSLTLTPFATGSSTYTQDAAWRKAVLQLSYQSARTDFDVRAAAWNVTVAGMTLANAEASLALEEERAAVKEKAYPMGGLTFDELQTERSALTNARQNKLDAQKSLINARASLYRLIGAGSGQPDVVAASMEELTALVAARDAAIAALPAGSTASLALGTLQIDRDTLQKQLAATPLYSPSLSVSGSVSYPLDASASISFSFSPSDFKTSERTKIADSLSQKDQEIEIERMAVTLQAEVQEQALAVARQALEARQAEVKQAQTALAEAKILETQGRATSLERRQAEIDLASAQARLYAAVTSVLAAQADILLSATP